MVKQILSGVDVHEIPVKLKSTTSFVFNYNMLKYFNIDEQKLPVDSIILGKPDTRLVISRGEAISIAIIIFLLIVILLLLLLKSQRLSNAIKKSNINQKELEKSNLKFKEYIETSPVGILVMDSSGQFIEVNPKVCKISGYSKEELLNKSLRDCLIPDDLKKGAEAFDIKAEQGLLDMELRIIKKDGKVIWIRYVQSKINDNCYISFCMDISVRKEYEHRIEHLSFHDSLTDVNNRTFFEEKIKVLNTEQYLPLSYIIFDTNGLKLINDTMGHAIGDMVLIETAKILKQNIRKDDVLARIGGDEFSVLLPKTNNNEVQSIMNKLKLIFQSTIISIDDKSIKLSIASGCATKTMPNESFAFILKIAEDYMYTQKLLERDSYHSAILTSLKKSLFERSQETEEHAERLVYITSVLGKAMGLQLQQLNELELLATMHDIGKISIDNKILTKPDKLTSDEWLEMKQHPAIGYRIAMTSTDLKPISEYILCHHERWDGKGYPQGLKKESIPLLSRILAIADAYDAMISDRPYRKALSKEFALSEIARNAGTQFDPTIVKLFLKLILVSDIDIKD